MTKIYITNMPEEYMDYENVCGPQAHSLKNIFDASCEDIVARNILDTVPISSVVPTLFLYMSKVKRKGKLTIGGKDIDAIVKAYKNQLLSVQDFNNLVFGIDNLSISSIVDISNILESNGFKILSKKRDNYSWSLTAERQ